jgi:hypothetical protein
MKLQLLSDLHLETEVFDPIPAPGAELLVLAGDIDSSWAGLERFVGWPVPVLFVAGNHEFDGRELDTAWPALRARCAALGLTLLEREAVVRRGADGRRVRFVGTVRWCDFELFGAPGTEAFARARRAGAYFQRVMRATRDGAPFDAEAVRAEALACRAWLAGALDEPPEARWDLTVVITHFAPSARSVDPRYGRQPGSASFCNADDELIPHADLWLHGHLHCRHDYRVLRPDGGHTRVVCHARGLAAKGEADGHEPLRLIEV